MALAPVEPDGREFGTGTSATRRTTAGHRGGLRSGVCHVTSIGNTVRTSVRGPMFCRAAAWRRTRRAATREHSYRQLATDTPNGSPEGQQVRRTSYHRGVGHSTIGADPKANHNQSNLLTCSRSRSSSEHPLLRHNFPD